MPADGPVMLVCGPHANQFIDPIVVSKVGALALDAARGARSFLSLERRMTMHCVCVCVCVWCVCVLSVSP